jgi:hypothetical protein
LSVAVLRNNKTLIRPVRIDLCRAPSPKERRITGKIISGDITKGLIIGGKQDSFYKKSLEVFDWARNCCNKIASEISVFRNQAKNSRTDIQYSPKKDTYTIVSGGWPDNKIQSVEDLKNCFKEISIAPKDKLFIAGKRVSKSKYPELFRR